MEPGRCGQYHINYLIQLLILSEKRAFHKVRGAYSQCASMIFEQDLLKLLQAQILVQ
jgi:hypothetical protein